jgi:Fusaric acid resistance protein-like
MTFLPLAGTVGMLAGLAALGIGPPGLLVLGGALCLRAGRHPEDRLTAELIRLPLVVLAVAGLGLVFAHSRPAADALYLAVFAAARLAWRVGPTAALVGRALLLPLITLFVAPPVRLASDPAAGVAEVLLACAVATLWIVAVPRLWPVGSPSVTPLAAAARWPWRRQRRVARAALELDGRLPADATDARLAVLAVEHAVARGADPSEPLARARAALATLPAGPPEPAPSAAGGAPSAARVAIRTRLAVQSTVAVALAFAVGQLLFDRHWPWVVITVLAVSLRATSRGEVVLTTGERLLGALAGTAVATAVATLASPPPVPATLLVLAVLGAGMALRPYGYAWWAAAMTASLSLIYGLLGEPGGASVLGERLVAILAGGACAVLPAVLLAPVRTRHSVRRRLGASLRTVGAALREGPSLPAVRAADRELDLLRLRSRPLRLLRPACPEARWARTLLDAAPDLHTALLQPASPSRATLGATVRTLAADVKGG